MRMPFGKYQGYELVEVPKDYLKWVAENLDLYGGLRIAIFDVLIGKFGEKVKGKQGFQYNKAKNNQTRKEKR